MKRAIFMKNLPSISTRAVALAALAPLAVVAALAVGVAHAVPAGATEPRASVATVRASSVPLTRLRVILRALIRTHGDPAAQGRTAVRTTGTVARHLLGSRVRTLDARRAVYLLWAYGNFDRQKGTRRPTGYLVVAVVDAKTTRLVWGGVIPGELNPRQPNPERLGLAEISLAGDVRARAPDVGTLARIRTLALSQSEAEGEPSPTAVLYATNDQDVQAALQDSETSASGNPDKRAYLVVMQGTFEQNHSSPIGVTLPPTSYLDMELDARTLGVTTLGWANVAPLTTRLGPATPLLP